MSCPVRVQQQQQQCFVAPSPPPRIDVTRLQTDRHSAPSGLSSSSAAMTEIARRDRLRLPLSRSLSEPGASDGVVATTTNPASTTTVCTATCLTVPVSRPLPVQPAKKCKLETCSRASASLPPSPCSDAATNMSEAGRVLLAARLRSVRPSELAARLVGGRAACGNEMLVLDCRPFLAYNAGHVRTAVNVNCADRFHRKRLQLGKAGLVDLLSGSADKELFRRRSVREVVVYDDDSSCGVDAGSPLSGFNQPLLTVLCSLLDNDKEPVLLQGGLKEFQRLYPELCDNSLLKKQSSAPACLLSTNNNINTCNGSSATAFCGRFQQQPQHCTTSYVTEPAVVSTTVTPCGGLVSTVCSSDVEPDIENTPATLVMPHVFLGNERDAADLRSLQALDIRFVLNVTAHLPGYHEERGIRYKRLPAHDSTHQNLKQYFDEAFEFIEKAQQGDGNVLIHCQAGVSRSATIAIAYVMKRTRASMIDAYKLVKTKRPIISPNLNFMGQLLDLEQDLGSAAMIEQPVSAVVAGSGAGTSASVSSSSSSSNSGGDAYSTSCRRVGVWNESTSGSACAVQP